MIALFLFIVLSIVLAVVLYGWYIIYNNLIFKLLPIRDILTLYNYSYGNTTKSRYNEKTSQYQLIIPTDTDKRDRANSYAILMAQISWNQGGIPIGSVLVDSEMNIISLGHNRRHQNNDPSAHAEIDCLKNAGNRMDWKCLTLISTLSCCDMCTGSILLYGIKNVIILEDETYKGPLSRKEPLSVEPLSVESLSAEPLSVEPLSVELLSDKSIKRPNVQILKSGAHHDYCVMMMRRLFEQRNDLWNRDIGVTECNNAKDCVKKYGYPNNSRCIDNKCSC